MPIFDSETVHDGGGPGVDYSSANTGYQDSTRTGSDVALAVRRMFGDESGVQVLDSDILRWINDAQDSISNLNRAIKARGRMDSIKGTANYRFPNHDIQQVESLHYGGSLLKNVPYSEAEQQGYLGSAQSGQPQVWWEWAGEFTLWPTPDSSARVDLRYTMRPTKLASLTDMLGVPDKYYQTVVIYVMQQAYELDENFQAAQMKSGQFRDTLADFGEEERTAQNMVYESITVLPDDF